MASLPHTPIRAPFLINNMLAREWANFIQHLRQNLNSFSEELWELTDAEVQQLQNIGSTTISAAQWAYLGALDQALATTDDVNFNTVNGIDIAGLLGNIVSITDDYTASFYDFLLCDGNFTTTMPDITSDDLGKPVTIVNVGTGIIIGDGDNDDTFYGEKTIEIWPEDTLSLKPITTSAWRLV